MLCRSPPGTATEAIGETACDMERGRGRATVLEECPFVAQRGRPLPVGTVSDEPGVQMLAMAPVPLRNLEGPADGVRELAGRALKAGSLNIEYDSTGASQRHGASAGVGAVPSSQPRDQLGPSPLPGCPGLRRAPNFALDPC